MLKTFENRDDCILPPYHDDDIITLALLWHCRMNVIIDQCWYIFISTNQQAFYNKAIVDCQ